MDEQLCRRSLHMSPIQLLDGTRNAEDVDPDELGLLEYIEYAVEHDNKDLFVEIVNGLACEEELHRELSSLLFYHDAVNCATAVLTGETAGTFNLTTHLSQIGIDPIIEVIENSSPRILALLLDSGFMAYGKDLKNMLPLTVALKKTRERYSVYGPEGGIPAIQLVSTLCFCVMRRNLETLRLVAHHTKEIKREFFNYLKEGQMVEVGALLMVASELLLSPSTSEEDDAFGFKSIADMHHFLLAKKPLSSDESKNGLMEVEKELPKLLEIFDKARDQLAAYLRLDKKFPGPVGLQVESLVKDAGFHVNFEDTDHYAVCRIPVRNFCGTDPQRVPVDDCGKKIRDPGLLPSWWSRNKPLQALGGKSDSSSHLSRRLFSTTPLLNTNSVCLAPAKSLVDGAQRLSFQKRVAFLGAALRKGLRRV